jgi:hypothetical protein
VHFRVSEKHLARGDRPLSRPSEGSRPRQDAPDHEMLARMNADPDKVLFPRRNAR